MKIFLHVALIVLSFAFVYVFSYSTSFGYDLLGGDSAIFQAIGKGWTQGYLPYVDLFDHKGPLIFFINALGYMIYPRAGIMVPQVVCLYLSCLFIWRAMELYSSSRWKIFFMLFTLIYYATHYEEGNHVEEYSVLFLSVAAYCFLRSLKENNFRPLYGFVYGLGFGACFMNRLTDSAQICCQVFLVAVFLLQMRDFKALWQNVLSFCIGFVTIVLPFVIYFAAHDALYDMFYGTILFNLQYVAYDKVYLTFGEKIIYDSLHFLPLFIMIIVALFGLKDNPKSRLLLSGIFIGVMLAFLMMRLRPYGHYALILFATVPILFAVLQESNSTLKKLLEAPHMSTGRIIIKLLVVLFVFHLAAHILYLKALLQLEPTMITRLFSAYPKNAETVYPNERENILKLQALIPDAERKSFVIWANFNIGSHWILRTDMMPRERLFRNNSPDSRIDPRLREEFFNNLRRDYPLWILYGSESQLPDDSTNDPELEQLLAEKYLLKGEAFIFPQTMKLYRLKE